MASLAFNERLSVYQKRRPEKNVLYQAVKKHLPLFLKTAQENERSVPKFVQHEFETFLECGIIKRGAVRVRCEHCGYDRLVAFSCKSRSGLCSSCAAKRMHDVATHLCDHVIPNIPIRQWVITVPHPIRYLLAYDAKLLSKVIHIFVRAIFAHLRKVAQRELALSAKTIIQPGAICVPQRFNSAMGLAPHFHAIVSDGVWIQNGEDEIPKFCVLPGPRKEELTNVAYVTCKNTIKLLKKRGIWHDEDTGDDTTEDRLSQEEPLLATLAAASIRGVLAMGPNAGMRPMRLFGQAARNNYEQYIKEPKNTYGFDLHASSRASANDKKGRERLCRYLLRPPLSNDRLTNTTDGKYRITLKRVWDDGTTHIVVSGQELIAKLAVLIPPARMHTTRYFGAWAPRCKIRKLIVPTPPENIATETTVDTPNSANKKTDELDIMPANRNSRSKRYKLTWVQALAKVFAIDINCCPRCKKQGMQQISVITDEQVIQKMLAHISVINAKENIEENTALN